MRKKVVVALGGNALGKNPREQEELIKNTAKNLTDLICRGYDIIITHGNGPQIGMISLAFEYSNKTKNTPVMPFSECSAMSQGYIGYQLQQALKEEFLKRKINKEAITVVTQIVVDKNDKAFLEPTKPIGDFYTKEEAEKLEKEQGYIYKEDAGRGYRRVVASPSPVEIVELKSVNDLINKGYVVITCGGGGIPVVKENNEYKGIDAVIDKDASSAKLAEHLNADILLILTNVEKVSINYNKENEEKLNVLNLDEIEEYIKEGQFAKGSMLPKIEACKSFVQTGKRKKAIITSLDQACNALLGKNGTLIKGGK